MTWKLPEWFQSAKFVAAIAMAIFATACQQHDAEHSTPASAQQNTAPPARHAFFPARSPDGTRSVFTSALEERSEILVMDASGANVTNLTMARAGELELSRSPDGKRIAFVSIPDNVWQIYTLAPDGSNVTIISSSEEDRN